MKRKSKGRKKSQVAAAIGASAAGVGGAPVVGPGIHGPSGERQQISSAYETLEMERKKYRMRAKRKRT